MSGARTVAAALLAAFAVASTPARAQDVPPVCPAIDVRSFDDPVDEPLAITTDSTRRTTNATEIDLHFMSQGRLVGATLVRALRGTSHAGVLWVHWLGDDATTNRTEFIGDARALAGRGVTSLLVDAMWAAPGWFEHGRRPDTDPCDATRQVIALRRALDVLAQQPDVDPARLAYVGHDFGAMYGALLVSVDPRPRYAVFMTPALSFWEWFLLGAQPDDPGAYVRAMSAIDLPPWLARTTVAGSLLQLAARDVYVSPATGVAFFNALPNRDRTRKTYPADHALRDAAGRAAADRRGWLLRRLSPMASVAR